MTILATWYFKEYNLNNINLLTEPWLKVLLLTTGCWLLNFEKIATTLYLYAIDMYEFII